MANQPRIRLYIEEISYKTLDMDYSEFVKLTGGQLEGIPPLESLIPDDVQTVELSGSMTLELLSELDSAEEIDTSVPEIAEIRLLSSDSDVNDTF